MPQRRIGNHKPGQEFPRLLPQGHCRTLIINAAMAGDLMNRRTILTAALGAALISGPAQADITFDGGAGDSFATAIIVLGAEGSSDGIQAEYDWLGHYRPGAQVLEQALLSEGERMYDMLTIRYQGREEQVFFDITDFFGRF
jgi:hypothetical protein